MKIYLITLLSILLAPVSVALAVGDVTLSTTETVLSVNGYSWTVTGSDAVLDSIAVNGTDFSLTMSQNQEIKLVSTDRIKLSMTQIGSIQITSTCNSSQSTYTFTNPNGGVTVTFTVSQDATACATGGASGGNGSPGSTGSSGGGGGGGGGSFETPSPAPAPVAPVTPALVVANPSPVAQIVSPVFNQDLSFGSENDDVMRLQQLLANDLDIYPEGKVTGYFGALTQKAVKKFQAKHGLPTVGRVGPATRAKLAEIFGAGNTPSAVPTPATPYAMGLTRELERGSEGSDVKALQEFLAKDTEVYPEGLATGYYGNLTVQAVRRFQAKYGISQVGRVGPMTLLKLQELMK